MVDLGEGAYATLGFRTLLGSAPVRWRLAEGPEPVIETYDVDIADVPQFEAFGDQHKPLDLELNNNTIGPGGARQLGRLGIFKNLRVITAEPGPNPHIGRIQVGDIRWLFPYLRIWKQYNVRYRKSVAKRDAWGGEVNLQQDVSQDQYESWSLDPLTGQPWTALDIILDIITNPIDGLNRGHLQGELARVEVGRGVDKLKSVSLENILIDDDGAGALRRALALLPGLGFTITAEGKPKLINKFDVRDELNQMGKLGPPIVDGGIIRRISNSTTRPQAVHVFFPRKVEVRFNFQLGDPAFQGEGDSRRLMENVILVVDPGFTDDQGVAVPQGTWLNVEKYIAALQAQAAAIKAGRLKAFSRKILDQAMVPWMGLWAMLEAAGLDDLAIAQADKFNWASRLGSLQQHYLQTFRLNPSWTRRARLIEAKLVGIYDNETGTRADSPVWMDYSTVPSQKALLVASHKGVEFCLATDKLDFPGSVPGLPAADLDTPIPKDSAPSPYRVDILDQDQGLIRITPRGDVYGNWETLIPAPLLNRPCYNPEKGLKDALSFDSIPAGAKDRIPRLDSDAARACVVLTLVPATPNNMDQFHRIEVKPGDLKAILPEGARRGLGNAKGPIQEVLIKDEVARVIWIDNPATISITHRMFDLPLNGPANLFNAPNPLIESAFTERVTRLEAAGMTLNDDIIAFRAIRLNIGSGANLGEIALARAAQVYASEQDRHVGSQTAPFTPDIRPAGFLSEVIHTVETDGMMVTHVQLPAAVPGIELETFLDENTRKVLNKELGA